MRRKAIKFSYIAEHVEELNGKTIAEITDILGYKNINVANAALYSLRRNNKLDFAVKNGIYRNFEVIDTITKGQVVDKKSKEELSRLKIQLYVEDVINMRAIANNPAIKSSERLKATEHKQRALKHLEGVYALEVLKSHGITEEVI